MSHRPCIRNAKSDESSAVWQSGTDFLRGTHFFSAVCANLALKIRVVCTEEMNAKGMSTLCYREEKRLSLHQCWHFNICNMYVTCCMHQMQGRWQVWHASKQPASGIPPCDKPMQKHLCGLEKHLVNEHRSRGERVPYLRAYAFCMELITEGVEKTSKSLRTPAHPPRAPRMPMPPGRPTA